MDRAVAPGSRVAADPLGNGLPRIAPAASVLVPESPLPRLSTLRARALPIMVNNAPGAWICRSAGRSHAIPREGQICRRVSRWAVPSCYKGFAAVPRREIAAATILSYALHGRRQSLRTPRALHREVSRRTARSYNGCVHHAPIRYVILISIVVIGEGIVILERNPSPIPAVPAALNRCLAGLLVEACGPRMGPTAAARGRPC